MFRQLSDIDHADRFSLTDGSVMSTYRVRAAGQYVAVWDRPTRLFHWSLVGLTVSALATGYLAPEWWLDYHVWAGYGIGTLLVFRVVWGIFGSHHSRFANFRHCPRAVLAHLRSLLDRRPSHHIGHNPAGSWMIFTLLAVLAGSVLTGIVVLGGQESQGPLASVTPFFIGDKALVIHTVLAGGLLALIAAHVLGVIAESRLTGENLAACMIHGKKKAGARHPATLRLQANPLAAGITLVVTAISGAVVMAATAALPPLGMVSMPTHGAFESECGECHELYHPSLLPGASWQGLMATLDDHFGEDASLDEETATSITIHLVAHAAEYWETEPAQRLGATAPREPWRITATPYWKQRHAAIDDELFERPPVKSKSNCHACHEDAASGRFDDRNIQLPEKSTS